MGLVGWGGRWSEGAFKECMLPGVHQPLALDTCPPRTLDPPPCCARRAALRLAELGERMMSVERALVREREAHLATKQQVCVCVVVCMCVWGRGGHTQVRAHKREQTTCVWLATCKGRRRPAPDHCCLSRPLGSFASPPAVPAHCLPLPVRSWRWVGQRMVMMPTPQAPPATAGAPR